MAFQVGRTSVWARLHVGGTDVEELLYIAGPEEVLVLVVGPGLWVNVCVCVFVCVRMSHVCVRRCPSLARVPPLNLYRACSSIHERANVCGCNTFSTKVCRWM